MEDAFWVLGTYEAFLVVLGIAVDSRRGGVVVDGDCGRVDR